jgi:ribosome modulation factor
MKNTFLLQRERAWKSGFNHGKAGNTDACPPYLVAPTTQHLIQEWRDGHRAGLEQYRHEVERARLEKVKRVDAMRGPR